MPAQWGRKLVYGCAVPAWQFQPLDADGNPITDYSAEFVMKRTPADAKALKTWNISNGGLQKTGTVCRFKGAINVKVQDVVIGGWIQPAGADKIPIEFDYFKIIINTTP